MLWMGFHLLYWALPRVMHTPCHAQAKFCIPKGDGNFKSIVQHCYHADAIDNAIDNADADVAY